MGPGLTRNLGAGVAARSCTPPPGEPRWGRAGPTGGGGLWVGAGLPAALFSPGLCVLVPYLHYLHRSEDMAWGRRGAHQGSGRTGAQRRRRPESLWCRVGQWRWGSPPPVSLGGTLIAVCWYGGRGSQTRRLWAQVGAVVSAPPPPIQHTTLQPGKGPTHHRNGAPAPGVPAGTPAALISAQQAELPQMGGHPEA